MTTWRLRTTTLDSSDHTLIMGVVNVTPDSFSDGGAFHEGARLVHERAIVHGLGLIAAGADVVDVGGESTRPGAEAVAEDLELERVLPVIGGLVGAGAVTSVDTSKPAVAAAALQAGAEIVNDVTSLASPGMAAVCAGSGCGVVLMHMQGTPQTMQARPSYADVVTEVASVLRRAADDAIAAGIPPDRICLDPGIGFGKTAAHSLALLRSLDRLVALGHPVLVGPSRKSFLGAVLEAAGHPASAELRDPATFAAVALAVAKGAAVVRVHDVVGALQAARTADAIVRSIVLPDS